MSDTLRTRLYEKGWKYTPAAETNLAEKFKRIKREQKQAAQDNVRPMVRKGK